MSDRSEAVKLWRKVAKQRMIDSMGGKCQICSYKRCASALEFHHLDPSKKDLSFGKVRANCWSWDRLTEELRKCVLLCSNCHKEVHNGMSVVPDSAAVFDESFADYKVLERQQQFEPCPVCGTSKPVKQKTCSLNCGATIRYGERWATIDVISLVENDSMNYEAIGRLVGCTGAAAKKRYLKMKCNR